MDSRARKAAKRRIRWLWEARRIRYTEHAERRLAECSLDELDLQNVIRYGRITHECPGLYSETPRRFRLKGKSVDGGTVICIVEANSEMVLVTAFSKRGKR